MYGTARNSNGKVLGLLSQDTIVGILGEQSNWFEISHRDGTGFVRGDYVRPVAQISTLKARVTAARLNVRSAPSRTAPITGTLPEGHWRTCSESMRRGWKSNAIMATGSSAATMLM